MVLSGTVVGMEQPAATTFTQRPGKIPVVIAGAPPPTMVEDVPPRPGRLELERNMPPRAPGVNIADAPPPKKMVEDAKKKVRLELKLGFFRCGFGSLRIDEDAVANDERILAHVSREEARTYIRGVNAHHEKGTRRYRMLCAAASPASSSARRYSVP